MAVIVIFAACSTTGETKDYDVLIKRGNKEYKVKRIYINSNSDYIYVIYPVGDSTLPEQVTTVIPHGKTTVTETTVELQ